MKGSKLIASLLSITAITGCSQVADIAQRFTEGNAASQIAPYIYLATYSYSGSLSDCLSNAEKALRTNGFTDNPNRRIKDTYGTVSADNPEGLIAAKVECDSNMGTTAFAVSSNNNASAFNAAETLQEAEW